MMSLRARVKRHEILVAVLVVGAALIASVGIVRMEFEKFRHRQLLSVWNVSSMPIEGVSVRSQTRGTTVLRGRLLPDAMIIETVPNLSSDTYELILDGVRVATCVAGPAPNDRLLLKIVQIRPPVVACDSSVKGED